MIITAALPFCSCGCGQLAAVAGRFARGHKSRRPLADRLWPKVQVGASNACWPWVGAKDWCGYGKIGITHDFGEYRATMAHRVVYETTVGPIPEGMKVLHHCDNPPCCNPVHLFLGTNADNTRDMVVKGRHRRVNTPEARRNMSEAAKRRYAQASVS